MENNKMVSKPPTRKEQKAKHEEELLPILNDLKNLHKVHGLSLLRAGCNRYLNTLKERDKIEKKIRTLEASLVDLKRKVKI